MLQASEAILKSIVPSDHVVVFTNVQLWDVHLAEAYEVARHARATGAQVSVLLCRGQLSSCPANALHEDSKCIKCNKKSDAMSSALSLEGLQFIYIPPTDNFVSANQLESISTRAGLLSFCHDGVPIGRLVATQIADDQRDFYFSLDDPEVKMRANDACASAVGLYEFAKNLLTEVGATKVFVWNGRRPSDGPIVYAAESAGVSAYTYISGGSPGKIYVTRGRSVQEHTLAEVGESIDELCRIHGESLDEVGASYLNAYRSGSYNSLGYVQFRDAQAEKLDPMKSAIESWTSSPKQKVLVVTSSPIESLHLRETATLFGDDPYGWIERLQQSYASREDVFLCIRWHPSQALAGTGESSRIANIMFRAPTGVLHLAPDVQVDAYLLAEAADVVIGTGSNVMVWAASVGTPVVCFGQEPTFLDSAWTRAESEAELLGAIERKVPPIPHAALLWATYVAEFGVEMQHVFWDGRVPNLKTKAEYRKFRRARQFLGSCHGRVMQIMSMGSRKR